MAIKSFSAVALLSLFLASPLAIAADWDHIHLVAPDTKAAAEWYAEHFNGKVTKSGPFDAVLFGDKLVKFKKGSADTKGSNGCAVDHLAFAVPSVPDKVKILVEAGLSTHSYSMKRPGVAILSDPWGTQVELIKAGEGEEVEGFHHVHLRATNPRKAAAWYAEVFGGELTVFRGAAHLPAIKYNGMWLVVQRASGRLYGTKDRSVDHLGWTMDDFDGIVKKLKAMDTKFVVDPQRSGDHMMAFIESPEGVKIELVGKPDK